MSTFIAYYLQATGTVLFLFMILILGSCDNGGSPPKTKDEPRASTSHVLCELRSGGVRGTHMVTVSSAWLRVREVADRTVLVLQVVADRPLLTIDREQSTLDRILRNDRNLAQAGNEPMTFAQLVHGHGVTTIERSAHNRAMRVYLELPSGFLSPTETLEVSGTIEATIASGINHHYVGEVPLAKGVTFDTNKANVKIVDLDLATEHGRKQTMVGVEYIGHPHHLRGLSLMDDEGEKREFKYDSGFFIHDHLDDPEYGKIGRWFSIDGHWRKAQLIALIPTGLRVEQIPFELRFKPLN